MILLTCLRIQMIKLTRVTTRSEYKMTKRIKSQLGQSLQTHKRQKSLQLKCLRQSQRQGLKKVSNQKQNDQKKLRLSKRRALKKVPFQKTQPVLPQEVKRIP